MALGKIMMRRETTSALEAPEGFPTSKVRWAGTNQLLLAYVETW